MSSPAALGQTRRDPRRSLRAVLWLAILSAVVVCGLDQTTKAIVERTMTLGQEIPLIDGLLQWHYILNPGAAFSMGESFTWVFTAIMAIVSVGILICLPRVRSLLWALALGLVLGGALGNLTDRLLRWPGFPNGHVVDFIHVQGFAVFNIADSGVVVGVILVAALILLGREPDGTRSGGSEAADGGPGEGAATEEITPEETRAEGAPAAEAPWSEARGTRTAGGESTR